MKPFLDLGLSDGLPRVHQVNVRTHLVPGTVQVLGQHGHKMAPAPACKECISGRKIFY